MVTVYSYFVCMILCIRKYNPFIDSKCCARLGTTLHYLLHTPYRYAQPASSIASYESARETGHLRVCGGETLALERDGWIGDLLLSFVHIICTE